MISRLHVQGESATPAGVFLTTDQNESTVAVFAFDKVFIAQLLPDARVAKSPAAAIAGDLMAVDHHTFRRGKNIALRRHDLAYPLL
jgi:hypothetical protein